MRLFFISSLLLFLMVGWSVQILSAQYISPYQQEMFERASEAFHDHRYAEVVEILKNHLDSRVETADPWLMIAASYMEMNDLESAEAWIDKALTIIPDDSRLMLGMADIYLYAGQYKEALVLAQRVRQLELSGSKAIDDLHSVTEMMAVLNTHLGGEAAEQGRPDDAENYFREALRLQPDEINHYRNMAVLYVQNEEYQRALEVIDDGLIRFPNSESLNELKIHLLGETREFERLEKHLADLVAADPNQYTYAAHYVMVLLYNQKFEAATEETERIIGLDHLSSDRFILLAEAYEQAGYLVGAIGILQRYLKKYPEDEETALKNARLLEQAGEDERAEEMYRKLSDGETGYEARLRLAEFYLRQNNPHTALEIYYELAKNFTDEVEILWKQARLLGDLDRWEESVGPLEQILTLNQANRWRYEMAYAKDRAGFNDVALDMYQTLAEEGFYHPVLFFRLAQHGKPVPGLGEGCGLYSSVFQLVLRHMLSRQENMLAEFQEEEEVETERKPGDVTLEKLDEITYEIIEGVQQQCDQDEAEQFMRDLITRYGSSGRVHLMVSRYYKGENQNEQALEHAEFAAELAPGISVIHRYHAQLLEEAGRIEDARLAWQKVTSLDPEHEAGYAALLRIHRNKNRLDELCDQWLIKYRVNRDNEVLVRYLKDALLRAGRWDEAKKLREQE